jgi:hypothetical protein
MIPPNPSPFIPPRPYTFYSTEATTVGLECLKARTLQGDRLTLLKQLKVNMIRTFVQDTSFFKIALAPIASALLVATRVGTALKSAKDAHNHLNPEEAEYAQEQALMTMTREVAGFGLSYGLMSVLNIATDKPVQRLFGYNFHQPDVTGPVKGITQAIEILVGTRKEIEAAPFALGGKTIVEAIEEQGKTPNFVQKTMRCLLPYLTRDARLTQPADRMKAGMKNVRGIGIPLLSAGISIYLAGWLLERTALLKTEAIMARIKQKRHKKPSKTTTPISA